MLNVELPLRTLDLRWFYQAVRKTSYDGQTFPAELLTVELPVTTSVLRWFYREVRKMLREMKYGETLPVELGNELSKILMRDLRTELVIERNLSWPDTGEELEKFKIELEKLVQDEIAAEIEIVERRQRGEFAEYAPQDLPGYKRDPDPLQERLRQIYDRSMQEDWAARWKSAGQRIPAKPQLRRFARLKHGEGIETLRALVNRAWLLQGRRFPLSRKEFQKIFARIIASAPKSHDGNVVFDKRCGTWNFLWQVNGAQRSRLLGTKREYPTKAAAWRAAESLRYPDAWIEFVARNLTAVAAGYTHPSTGYRKIADLPEFWCQFCGKRPAIWDVVRDDKRRRWCGDCQLPKKNRS